MKLSDSVILPREDFVELESAAFTSSPTTVSQRIGFLVSTTIWCTVVAGAGTLGTWGWVKAMDWREQKFLERLNANPNYKRPTIW